MDKETTIDLISPESLHEKANRTEAKKAAPEPAEPKATKPRKSRIWLYAAAGVLPILAGGAVAVSLGWVSVPGRDKPKKPETHTARPAEVGPMVKLSPLIINLKEDGGTHYVKTTIVLELSKKEVEEVEKRKSFVTDAIILTVSDKRLEDLKAPESKDRLKQELVSTLNQHFGSQQIKQIYFDEFLYQ